MSREPRTERHAALQLAQQHSPEQLRCAGERLMRSMEVAYPGKRYPRTLLEAYPRDSWRGVVTHYKQPLHVRVAGWIRTGAVLGAFAFIGFLLAWKG